MTKNFFVTFLLGIVSGIPLAATQGTLQAWLVEEGVDIKTIGLFSIVAIPWSLKFLWAPLLDTVAPFFLGQRRGWLITLHTCCAGTFFLIAWCDPKNSLFTLSVCTFAAAFFSASQDVVIDAHRCDTLSLSEQGLGSGWYTFGYRLGMLASGAGALLLADNGFDWSTVYEIIGVLIIVVGYTSTFLATEPIRLATSEQPGIFAIYRVPLQLLLSRKNIIFALLFILLYKLGDNLASAMTTPFILKNGFTKTDIVFILKLYGPIATIVGSLLGGVFLLKFSLVKALFFGGILQMISTLGFMLISEYPGSHMILTIVMTIENFSSGFGTVCFIAFLAGLTDVSHSASQYALLSSIMSIPRTVFPSTSGYLADACGWSGYFLLCGCVAIPGLLLITKAYKAVMDQGDTPTPV
jgi:MFS transporter, PAT family, beta-lactamase induction signal transducer AmpG